MRLSTFTQFSVTNDPTWNNIPTTVWCTLEVGVAFICAAVPAIYAWMRVLFPKLRQYTSRAFSSGTGAKENSLQYPGSKRRSGLQKKHKSLYPLESMMTHGADERYSLKSTTTQEREEHAFGSAIELRGFKKDSTEGV